MEELLKMLEEYKSGLKTYNEKYESATTPDDKKNCESMIDYYKEKIEKTTLQIDVEKIKPYLAKKNVHINLWPQCDHASYVITKFQDINVLEYKTDFFKFSYGSRKKQHGIVVFDNNGNVMLDNIDLDDSIIANKHLKGKIKSGENYYLGDPSVIFINGENIVLPTAEDHSDYAYTHYKLVSGKFEKVHTFTKNDCPRNFYNIPDFNVQLLKTKNDDNLASIYGRLYSFSEGKYLSDIAFDNIFDSTFSVTKTPKMGCSPDDTYKMIIDTVDKYDVLVGTFRIILNKGDINTVVFLDTKGNIVSDLIYCISFDNFVNLRHVETSTFGYENVTNESYSKVIKELITKAEKFFEDTIESEKKALHEEELRRIEMYKKRLSMISESFDIGTAKNNATTRSRKSKYDSEKEN